jgi:hypothetical protein
MTKVKRLHAENRRADRAFPIEPPLISYFNDPDISNGVQYKERLSIDESGSYIKQGV